MRHGTDWRTVGKNGANDLIRMMALAGVCLLLLVLLRHGFAPRTRAVTFLGGGIVFAMAVSYELIMRECSEIIVALAIAAVAACCALLYGATQLFDPVKP